MDSKAAVVMCVSELRQVLSQLVRFDAAYLSEAAELIEDERHFQDNSWKRERLVAHVLKICARDAAWASQRLEMERGVEDHLGWIVADMWVAQRDLVQKGGAQ